MNWLKQWLSVPDHRKWLYGVLVAAGPILAGLGVAAETWSQWLNLASAILLIGGGSLAAANVTGSGDSDS